MDLSGVRVVLVRTQGPINLGLCARACANLGVSDLRLVRPLCAVDTADARRFANHARRLLLEAPRHDDLAEAIADCGLAIGTSARERDEAFGPVRTAAELPALLAERPAARTALVFGNEADGLDADELRRCQAVVRLATPGPYPSYNLSHAVAIALYLMAAAGEPTPAAAAPPAADRARVDDLYRYWLATLERFRYFRRTPRDQWAPRFADLLNRLPLSDHDVHVLRGMLAQFNHVAFGDKAPDMARTGRPPEHADRPEAG